MTSFEPNSQSAAPAQPTSEQVVETPVSASSTRGDGERARVHVHPGDMQSDMSSGQRRTRWLRALLPWAVGLAVACAWDRAAYLLLAVNDPASLTKIESADWYRTLRVVGAPYIWFFVAVIFVIFDAARSDQKRTPDEVHDRYFTGRTPAFRRATFLLLSALGSGAAAELVKAVVGRYKPDGTDGWYRFASLHERFIELRWNDLGFVSSHAATAFGACFALSIMLPRATFLFVSLAIGCSLTRLLSGAHYLSDTYGAVLLAYLVTHGWYRLDRRNNSGIAIDRT